MVIYTEDGQSSFQPVHHHSLFFTRKLLASNSKNDRINALLPLISSLGSHQVNFLYKSYNLEFNFALQHIEISNPRTSTPHLLFFSPPFFLFFHSIFSLSFSLIFLKKFFLLSHAKPSDFSSKFSPYPIRGTPFK